MSYDIYVSRTVKTVVDGAVTTVYLDQNITWNLQPIFEVLFGSPSLRCLDNRVHDIYPEKIAKAVGIMETEREFLKLLLPENGWGSLECIDRMLLGLTDAFNDDQGKILIEVY